MDANVVLGNIELLKKDRKERDYTIITVLVKQQHVNIIVCLIKELVVNREKKFTDNYKAYQLCGD